MTKEVTLFTCNPDESRQPGVHHSWNHRPPQPAPWSIEHLTEALNGPVRLCTNTGEFVCEVRPADGSDCRDYPASVTHMVRCVNVHFDLTAALLWAEEQFAIAAGMLKALPASDGKKAVLDRLIEGHQHVLAAVEQASS